MLKDTERIEAAKAMKLSSSWSVLETGAVMLNA